MQKNKGFTLIELLVVIAIIGLLSTLAVVALNSAREKSRDAKRISDIKQVQTALELHYAENQQYPIATGDLGTSPFDRLDGDGFVAGATSPVFMGMVPKDPTNSAPYVFTYTSASPGNTYELTFSLEGTTGGLSGSCTASPDGVVCVP